MNFKDFKTWFGKRYGVVDSEDFTAFHYLFISGHFSVTPADEEGVIDDFIREYFKSDLLTQTSLRLSVEPLEVILC